MTEAADALAPFRLADVAAVPPRRGEFERIDYHGGIVVASGWLHAPGDRAEAFALYSENALGSVVPAVARRDVRANFASVMTDDRVGFHASALLGEPTERGWFHLHAVAFSGGRAVGRSSTTFLPGFDEGLPVPPARLMLRVANNASAEVFRNGGLRTAGVFFDAILRHADAGGVRRLLDWGSGCGRVTGLLLKYFGGEVTGCDIDAEGVDWCAKNLPAGRFVTIPPEPPTPFRDGEFDAICGYSVMTHLDRNRQVAWLRELRRIVRKGGLVLVTVHGETAASYAARRELVARLVERGVVDEIDDPNLDGVAPAGYYRETYQSRAWTEATWGRELELVEYVPGGMGGFQDLVVMRRV